MLKKPTSADFARDLVRIAEQYYGNWRAVMARSFLAGLFTALGATVGFALVLWAVRLLLENLGVLPVVGDFFNRVNDLLNMYATPK